VKRLTKANGVPKQASETSTEPLTLLSVLAPLVTIYGLILYVTGWTYLARYYDFFGLSMADAGIGTDGIVIHALSVIRGGHGYLVIIDVVFVAVLVIALRTTGSNNRIVSLIIGLLVLASIWIAYVVAGPVGAASAQLDASDESSLPHITIRDAEGSSCRTGKLLRRKDNIYIVSGVHDCKDLARSISTGIITTTPSDIVEIDHYIGKK
jgi:hypothetical protein